MATEAAKKGKKLLGTKKSFTAADAKRIGAEAGLSVKAVISLIKAHGGIYTPAKNVRVATGTTKADLVREIGKEVKGASAESLKGLQNADLKTLNTLLNAIRKTKS